MTRSARHAVVWFLLLDALAFSVAPAWGQARVVKPGDVIDQPGVFLPAEDALKAAEALEQFENLRAQIDALNKVVDGQLAQIELLESMQASSDREIAIKDLIIQHKDEMIAFRKEISDEWKRIAEHSKEQLAGDRDAILKLQQMVADANKRSVWSSIISFIVGAAASYFTFGIVH